MKTATGATLHTRSVNRVSEMIYDARRKALDEAAEYVIEYLTKKEKPFSINELASGIRNIKEKPLQS